MLAVIGLKAEVLENLCERLRAKSHRVWVSNYNCVGQYTLAGTARRDRGRRDGGRRAEAAEGRRACR